MFHEYQHLERFGATEVQHIELGECYIFPKIDGTNASIWMEDGEIKAGSRTRELSLEKDNAGFFAWAKEQEKLKNFFAEFPNVRLFGEWLVPHSLKTYRENAWRRFYIFDIVEMVDNTPVHVHYEKYSVWLESYGLDYIPPIAIINNANYEQLVNQLIKNVFLIEDGKGAGEGIVIKNYAFRNNYGRQTWAKIVTSEFKEKHAKEMGASKIEGKKMVEEEITERFVTKALCEKVHAKIENETGWSSKHIPRLLNTVYYDLIKEDCWEFVKEHKNPTINFKTLQHLTFIKVKEKVPQLF